MLANETQVVQAALEKSPLGQHRDRRCALRGIRLRQSERGEVGADHSLRGRRFFHLGNDRPAWPFPQGAEKRRGSSVKQGRVLELDQGHCLFLRCQFGAFVSDDVVEDHAGSIWVRVMKRSSVRAAAPLSSVAHASSIPAAREGTASPA